MNIKSSFKKYLPSKVISIGRKYFPRAGMLPISEFDIPQHLKAEAKAKFSSILWPNDRGNGRIIYALVPTPQLRNVGDQAQTVAILRWMKKHYPEMPIVEIDKDMSISCIEELQSKICQNDIIILHSGGNLGDRAKWSEAARRKIISSFKNNRIISLPQTIFFSDTGYGRQERINTSKVYSEHKKLTVLGRDKRSGELASEIFPNAQVSIAPDFVLSLDHDSFKTNLDHRNKNKILACLRVDDESIFTPKQRLMIKNYIPGESTIFDTDLPFDISTDMREKVLSETLSVFSSHYAVVTDRYHGLIFSIICRKPTVVLRTVDHKLTSAIEWFSEIPSVQFCDSVDKIEATLKKCIDASRDDYPDFNEKYFDKLPELFKKMI